MMFLLSWLVAWGPARSDTFCLELANRHVNTTARTETPRVLHGFLKDFLAGRSTCQFASMGYKRMKFRQKRNCDGFGQVRSHLSTGTIWLCGFSCILLSYGARSVAISCRSWVVRITTISNHFRDLLTKPKKKCQTEWQKECQEDCQKERQKRSQKHNQKKRQTGCKIRTSEEKSKDMPERMSEETPARMSDGIFSFRY